MLSSNTSTDCITNRKLRWLSYLGWWICRRNRTRNFQRLVLTSTKPQRNTQKSLLVLTLSSSFLYLHFKPILPLEISKPFTVVRHDRIRRSYQSWLSDASYLKPLNVPLQKSQFYCFSYADVNAGGVLKQSLEGSEKKAVHECIQRWLIDGCI